MRIHPFIFLFLWVVLFSCKKPVLNDTEVIPEDELGLTTTDTLTIQTFTVKEDSVSVRAEGVNKVVGTLRDNYYGSTYAGFYAQFYPPSGLVWKGSEIYVSLVLSMKYDFTYGDFTTAQNIEVYELDERIYASADKVYYSNEELSLKQPLYIIGRETVIPNLKDSMVVNGIKVAPQLRILLDADRTIGSTIMQTDSATLNDTSLFYSLFKGLYITSDTNSGRGLIFFKSSNADIQLTLYYQDSIGGAVLSKIFPMNIRGTLNGSINRYTHDYSGSTVNPFIKTPEYFPPAGTNDSITFLEPLSGLNTKIFVPYISNLGNIVITKADLIIKSRTPLDNTVFPVTQNLTLASSDSEGNQYGLQDQLFFGGGKVSSTDSSGIYSYKFNLARYYQSVSDSINQDFGIFILPANRTRVANMAALGGGNHPDDAMKMKLIVTYTKIE